MKRIGSFVILFLILLPLSINAQQSLSYFLPETNIYDGKIITPENFFGFKTGDYHQKYDQLISYIKTVATQSNRIVYEEYGKTYDQNRLYLLTISSAENIKRINELKAEHKLLSNPDKSGSLKLDGMPTVAWLGFTVHGNEASGTNAVPLLIYHLLAAQGKEIDELLANTIIIIDPCINPDGYDRFSNWVNSNRSKNANLDASDREHQENWPGNRGNHYWFDPNRDWLPVQHPEAQARVVKFHEWMPNVVTDHHEMGSNSTFFFQPGEPDRVNPLTPKENQTLTAKIASYHANALDKIGSLYFSQEVFDDYYYGKGSTYPDINGSVGILFEQAGVRGNSIETINGTMSFAFAIRNHLTTALSTLSAVKDLRIEMLNYQKNFFANAIKEAAGYSTKAFVFGSLTDSKLNEKFISILTNHSIDVFKSASDIKIGATEFFKNSSFIVPLNQPSFGLIKAIFEKNTQFKDSLFYDISAWTFPLGMNIPYEQMDSKTFKKDLLGEKITNYTSDAGKFVFADNSYAYAFKWNALLAPKFLNILLQHNIMVRSASMPFKAVTSKGEIDFGYGSIIIPLGIQKNREALIKDILQKYSSELSIDVYSIASGLTSEGIDLGSGNFKAVKNPKVMMLVGNGVSSSDAGEIWHMFDQRMGMNLTLFDLRNLGNGDLSKYNTIIMTSGTYGTLDSTSVAIIKTWIQNGGNFIATGTAVEWLKRQKISKVKTISKTPQKTDTSIQKPFAQRSKDSGALAIPGAIFEADIDITHPLGYGYNNSKLYIFVGGDVIISPAEDAYSNPVVFGKDPLVSGYISKRIYNSFKNSAAVVTERFGRGNLILMNESPNYRAFCLGTNKLFMNSVFFGSFLSGGSRE